MVSYLADRAEELAHMMNEAQEIARRQYMFSGQKAYAALWDYLTPAQRKEEIKREAKLKDQYEYLKDRMIAAAPSLLVMFGDDYDYTNVRIMLEITLDVAGVPYKPSQTITVPAAASQSAQDAWIEALKNPNHLAILPAPCFAYPNMNEGA